MTQHKYTTTLDFIILNIKKKIEDIFLIILTIHNGVHTGCLFPHIRKKINGVPNEWACRTSGRAERVGVPNEWA